MFITLYYAIIRY